jgi:Tol biopolymer transport system component
MVLASIGIATTMAAAGSSNGTIVYAVHPAGKAERVFVVSPVGSNRRVVPLPATACRDCVRLSPDGKRLLTADLGPGKRITTATLGLDGSGYRVFRLPGKTLNLGPGEWSPNGSRIAFEGWDDARPGRNGLYTGRSADGGGLRRVTASPGRDHDIPLSYSPDGSRILFARSKTDADHSPADLYVVRADGRGPLKLNPAGTAVSTPFGSPASWSADGKTVAFAAFDLRSWGSGTSAVFTSSPLGGDVRRITPWGSWTTSARFTPDGRWIVFDRNAGPAGHDVFLVRPDKTGLRTILSAATDGLGSCCAVWSPDGKYLVFQRGEASTASLWTMNADGGELRELSKTPGFYHYVWGR